MAWGMVYLGADVGTTGVRWAAYRPRSGTVEEVYHRRRRGRVVAALPADQAIFRIVELPRLDPRERRAALRWELQRMLPVPVDDAIYDYVELPGDPEADGPAASSARRDGGGSGPGRDVYVVSGAPVSVVDQRLDALRRRRIHPAVLEPEWVTLWRCAWWLGFARPEPVGLAVIDFGATSTRVMVIDRRGRPVVFHRSPIGCLALEEDLVRTLGELPSSVRRLLESDRVTDLGPLQASRAVTTLLGDLARSLRRVRTEMYVGDGGVELWGIGGGAQWPAMRNAVTEALGEPLHVTGAHRAGNAAAFGNPLLTLAPRWVLAGTLALWPARPTLRDRVTVVDWSAPWQRTLDTTGAREAPPAAVRREGASTA